MCRTASCRFGERLSTATCSTRLIGRGLVTQLPRRPGEKGERYMQLLGGGAAPLQGQGQSSGSLVQGEPEPSLEERVARIEEEVARLRDLLG